MSGCCFTARRIPTIVLVLALASSPSFGQDFEFHRVTAGLDDPVDVTAPAGDPDRVFVVEQRGTIRIVDLTSETLVATPFLDIQTRVRSGGERGLLGLAFHPDYATNGRFFVNYTRSRTGVCNASPPPGCGANRDGETVVAEYQVSAGDPNRAESSSERILFSFCQPFGNHNGGQVAFGPNDGYLYISTGDGGSGGDPCASGQRTESFLGKLLRIDVDSGDPYGIPDSNPYKDLAGARPEIWALGLRNPWRFSFDRANGDLYIGDVGQNDWEEIDYRPADSTGGENYEWDTREGNHGFSGTPYGPGTRVQPIYEYSHSTGRSVTGGIVYRGAAIPALDGRYFFADYQDSWIRSFRVNESGEMEGLQSHSVSADVGTVTKVSAFGTDAAGEIYLCDYSGGELFRIDATDPPNTPPIAVVTTDPDPADVELAGGTAQVTLDGSGSEDGEGGANITYLWERIAGPADGASIEEPESAVTTVTFDTKGEYLFRLTVDDFQDTDTAEADVIVRAPRLPEFVRGDANADDQVDLSDGVKTLTFLFLGDATLDCGDAADANDSGALDTSDAIYTFNFLFSGGLPIPEPTVCGPDTTEDSIDCEEFAPCG